MTTDDDKRAAAFAAVKEVRSGMRVGLGTGTTACFAIEEIGRRHAAGLDVRVIATSLASEARARALSLPFLSPEEAGALDLVIDGVDEIDATLRAIKGGGGAMLREKVAAAAATRMIAIADSSKRVAALGEAAAVPVEVLPFARAYVTRMIAALGGVPRLRTTASGIYRTDQDNVILDCRFASLADAATLAARLSAIPGLLGHGLFLDEIDALYIAKAGVITVTERSRSDEPSAVVSQEQG